VRAWPRSRPGAVGSREGEAALARGAWVEARAIFEWQLEAHETVEALEGLSWAAWWVWELVDVMTLLGHVGALPETVQA
jgi:hypothetical protein